MDLIVAPSGCIRHIYNDHLDLSQLGQVAITRASHVEPDSSGQWRADLSPVGGPILGPFTKRAAALAAEVEWLEQNMLPAPI